MSEPGSAEPAEPAEPAAEEETEEMLLEAAEAPDAVEAPPEETAGEGSEPPVELPKQPMSRSERRGMVVEFMGGGARPGPNRRQPRQGQGASAASGPGRRSESHAH